jgi:hypothetical protein
VDIGYQQLWISVISDCGYWSSAIVDIGYQRLIISSIVTCFLHDIAEKLLTWHLTTIADNQYPQSLITNIHNRCGYWLSVIVDIGYQ